MLSLWANWLQLNSQLNSPGVSFWLYRTSEKVDIYATISRYKNVQTIYDYFKNLPSTWPRQTCQLTPTMELVGTSYGVSWIMNVKHMGGISNSHSPVLILIQ